jgi:hypothetical protein
MHRILAILAGTVAAVILASTALADAVYHTAQVPLEPVGSAPGGGQVLNIHVNGPTVYAHEIYLLKHAAPGTYQVTIHIYPTSQDCTGPTAVVPTATLTTNAVGNGQARHFFTPADADAAGIRGLTLSAFWTVDGPASYATQCSVLTLD